MSGGGDAARIEASLIALADAGVDIRHALFDRFLGAFPERRAAFLNLDAASRRMTDETLQMLHGLAEGATWVWPLVAELVVTHCNYGRLTLAEYDAFVDMVIAEVAAATGPAWTDEAAAAWGRQGAALKALIHRAAAEWQSAMPEGAAPA